MHGSSDHGLPEVGVGVVPPPHEHQPPPPLILRTPLLNVPSSTFTFLNCRFGESAITPSAQT